jgi:transcriptional regulator with XRE-family HTH domain
LVFKYDKLKGRIREKLGTSEKLAQELGITSGALSAKLNNKSYFSQEQIAKSVSILSIDKEEVIEYFFCCES